MAWAVTIVLGVCTAGIAQGLSALWRHLHKVEEENETHTIIRQIFDRMFVSDKVTKESGVFSNDCESYTEGKDIIYNEQEIDLSYFQNRIDTIIERAGLPREAKQQLLQLAEKEGENCLILSPQLVVVTNRIGNKIQDFLVYKTDSEIFFLMDSVEELKAKNELPKSPTVLGSDFVAWDKLSSYVNLKLEVFKCGLFFSSEELQKKFSDGCKTLKIVSNNKFIYLSVVAIDHTKKQVAISNWLGEQT